MKFGKWRTEYTITALVLFGIGLVFMPTSIKSTVQANSITKWKDCYKKIMYTHDVILKQEISDILPGLRNTQNPTDRETLVMQLIKPYFRLNKSKIPKRYKIKYMNRNFVGKNDSFYTEDFYLTDNNMVVGIKDMPDEGSNDTKFLMIFDVNGLMPPNTWGKDVYGITVLGKKVEPLGENLRIEEQGIDCSPVGTGTSCSNYYLIGGGFND